MKVLLTGATGFLGSFVLQALIEKGVDTAILIRPSSDTWRIQSALNKVHLFYGDLKQLSSIKEKITVYRPTALVHLAWTGVFNTSRNHSSQVDNVRTSYNLFRLAIDSGVSTIMGFGSQAEYGPSSVMLKEDMLTQPTTFYGVTKLTTGHLLRTLCVQHNVRWIWQRIFSSYGPKDNPKWFIPSLILKLLKQEKIDLTEGKQHWDYLYVEDVANAILLALFDDKAEGVFNVGSGITYTIRDIAEKIKCRVDHSAQLNFGQVPYRPDQVMFLQANVQRLKQELRWFPKVPLEEGLERTVSWYKKDYARLL
jgi:nucleoside-diphosphate-sugar epimerase